ncbi:MAG: hypothetical protein J6I64_08510 [Lachnospiraceae bacterium]|nr:hypothetical protein [Lachnospiraceae bacterium]
MADNILGMAGMKEEEREHLAVTDPDKRIDYALVGYWKYWDLNGAKTWEEIEALMASASQDGDAAISRKVGDFMRFELQEYEADYYYAQAIRKTLEKGDSMSGDEMLALSQQYAYGHGMELSDASAEKNAGKAFFWCRQAAKKGDITAIHMMRHWWMDGQVFPGSRNMSELWAGGKVKDAAATSSQKEFYQAVTEKEIVSQKLDSCQSAASYKKNKQYTVIDLSKTPKAKARNPIVNLIREIPLWTAFIYGVVSLVAFLVTYFSGYQESGLFYQAGRLAFFLLGFPFKFFAAVFAWQGFEEGFAMTLPVFYEGFITRDGIFQFVLYLVMNLLILLVWYLVVAGITAFIFSFIDAFRIHGVKVEAQETKDVPGYEKQKAKLTEDLQVAKQHLEELCRKYQIPQDMWESPAKLLALYDISLVKNISLAEAACRYQKLASKEEQEMGTIQELFDVKRDDVLYAWYFYLRRNIYLKRKKALFPIKLYHAAPDSKLMKAYRDYRRGKDYRQAHQALVEVIESKDSKVSEKKWAQYCQVLVKKLDMLDWDFPHKSIMDDAMVVGCGQAFWRLDPYYVLYHERWASDPSQGEYLLKEYADPSEEEYFLERAAGEMWERRHQLGDPARRSHWNGYETKNLWAAYKELKPQYDKVDKRSSTDLDVLRKKVKRYTGKGHYYIDFMQSMIGSYLYDLGAKDREIREAQKARELEINRQMREFDKKADSFERSVNALRDRDAGLTQEERYWRGTADQQEYMDSWALRERARDRYREELEKELDGEE